MDRNEVIRIAKLARIAINDKNIAQLQESFSVILKHFDELSAINTDKVEPLFHFEESMPLREDQYEEPLSTEALMRNAPDSIDNSFKIPKVFGEQE